MHEVANLKRLINKVKAGTSTQEEDLALLGFLNASMQAFLALTRQLKIVKAKRSK